LIIKNPEKEKAMAKCEVCGKAIQIGNNVSHSNKKSKKTWHPNIKKIRVLEDNRSVKKYVCTRCIRSGKVLKAV
jgi:large subunit ribosomal protein L28